MWQDADSLDLMGTKSEGAYYLWTQQEIDDILGPSRAPLFKQRYYVKPEGNADLSPRSDPHGEFHGKNCLIARKSVEEASKASGESTGSSALRYNLTWASGKRCTNANVDINAATSQAANLNKTLMPQS